MGKQLIAMTNQCWKQQGCKSPHSSLLRVKCLRLSSDEKSAFVELLGRQLVSLGAPKSSANNFVALQLNQTGRNLSGPTKDEGRRYLLSRIPVCVCLVQVMRLLCSLA